MKERKLSHELLTQHITRLFERSGLTFNDASHLTKSLVNTSLWGIDSHGIARVAHYLSKFENGSLNKHPKFKFTKTGAATGRLDGDDGHGILIMKKAAELSVELAKDAGCGVVGVYNSSHCGAIGLYTRQITEAGMIGFAYTHADSLVVPHGGVKAFFGTNPISVAVPTSNPQEPVCLDMASSIVPWNYIVNARRENTEVEPGIGVNEAGEDSTDPKEIVAVKPMGKHKGFALAFLIDLLCGPLNGMEFGPNLSSMYHDLAQKRKLGSLIMALDPEKFGGLEKLKLVTSLVITALRSYGEEIYFPGEPEYLVKKDRTESGIPVSESLLNELNQWASKLGIESISSG